jgi:beta-lactamase regulating signal transducer with metallopeptidase domain
MTVHALGWTLLHFVWQGAAAAALLASLDLVLRRAAPQVRYLLATVVLALMALTPVATFSVLRAAPPAGVAADPALAGEETTSLRFSSLGPMAAQAAGSLEALALRKQVDAVLPLLVGLWGLGVLGLSLRSFGGWTLAQRMKRARRTAVPAAVEATFRRVIRAVGVSAAVRLYRSALVEVPTVIGWLRPVILLPASAATGLSAQQLELILAHELAHIRRHDYLVNLLQTVVETLLFYHPAVWWASHRMRVEREHCCDDLAVKACGNALTYARALAELEERRTALPTLAMAASGGSLLARVTRLVEPPRHFSRASRGLALLLAATALAIALCAGPLLFAGPPQAPEPPESPEPALAAETPEGETPEGDAPEIAEPPEADVPDEPAAQPLERPLAPPPPPSAPRPVQAPQPRQPPQPPQPPTPRAPRVAPLPSIAPVAPLPVVPAVPQGGPDPNAKPAPLPRPHGTLGPEPRAFPLPQILEMARQGITPEYIDAMATAGYAELSPEQLIALRSQGVGPDYVKELADQGLRELTVEQLVQLRSQGVSASFASAMKAQGLESLSISDLVALRSQGVSPEFVAELKRVGYDGLSVSKLIALRSQGVSGRFAAEMKALGYDRLSATKLIALRSQGVTPEYVKALAALGYQGLEFPMLIGLRSQGVSPEYVRGLKDAGYDALPAPMLMALRSQGVTPEYAREMNGAGGEQLSPEELIELRSNGVSPELVKRLRRPR